jgi:hypothetical protein
MDFDGKGQRQRNEENENACNNLRITSYCRLRRAHFCERKLQLFNQERGLRRAHLTD